MKFLADMGVSPLTVNALLTQGYDAIHLSEEGLFYLADSLIISKAKAENRVILTFDLDFGELLAFSGDTFPSVIIFRLEKANPDYVLSKLNPILQKYQDVLQSGAIIVIKDNSYRIRNLPIE